MNVLKLSQIAYLSGKQVCVMLWKATICKYVILFTKSWSLCSFSRHI